MTNQLKSKFLKGPIFFVNGAYTPIVLKYVLKVIWKDLVRPKILMIDTTKM